MTPPIPDIIQAVARIYRTSPVVILSRPAADDRADAARTLSMFLCHNLGYTIRQICDGTSLTDVDVRTAVYSGRRLAASSSRFRDSARLVRDILHASAVPATSPAGHDTFWTPADLRRIHQACLDAAVFMEHFGQGSGTRRPVVDGVGYYPDFQIKDL